MNNYILEKRTTESIFYDIDCTNLLDTNETISSITSVTSDQTGLTLSNQAVNTSPVTFSDGVIAGIGKVISIYISAGIIPTGSINQIYTIRPVFSTSEGNVREATVLLNVTNNPMQLGRIL